MIVVDKWITYNNRLRKNNPTKFIIKKSGQVIHCDLNNNQNLTKNDTHISDDPS